MSYTQDDISRLRSAIAKGALQLRMGEAQVIYRSLNEMRSVLAEMEASVGGAPIRQHYPQFAERPR